ncbi:MAG TPA: DUF4142 domain-containing protein, partial [Nevskiaceae bacterium]|nr:DUF4142 domain-containing protein [Nevskiaceae bacterium]
MKRMQSGPVALCLVLAVAGAYAGSSTDPTKASGPTTVKEDDLEFMTKASQAGMAEVQEAQVASTKAMDAGVRSFA